MATPAPPAAVQIARLGITIRPPAGWQRQDDVDGNLNGSVSFFAPSSERRSFHFNRPGFFVVQRWPTSERVSSEDLLLGFEDSIVPEFVTLIGSDPDVTEEPLRAVQVAGRAGKTTIVTIKNPSTGYRYVWWDLSTATGAFMAFCGASSEQFEAVAPTCQRTIQGLEITN
jgi:hypothetical protein